MVDKQLNASTKNNPLVRALDRWESEGGSVDADLEKRAALIEEEEHILQCPASAVVRQTG